MSTLQSPALGRLLLNARAVHAALDAFDAAAAERLGVHRSDLRCINLLEHGALSPAQIGRRLALSSGAVTALVDRLERAGFARRVPSPSDRRSLLVEIPPAAHARAAALYRRLALAVARRFAGQDEVAVQRAADALAAFAEACREAGRAATE